MSCNTHTHHASWKSVSVFPTAGQQQHQAAAGIVDVVVYQVGKESHVLQIDMNASSGAAHGWPEQQVGEALSELERPAMAGIDPNALHPAENSNGNAAPQVCPTAPIVLCELWLSRVAQSAAGLTARRCRRFGVAMSTQTAQ
jgi:hypothetical protein